MKGAVTAALAMAALVALSGCTAGASGSPAPSTAEAAGPEVWASASLWVASSGDVVMCGVPFTDGLGVPQICPDPLEVSGVDGAALIASTPGVPGTAREGADGWRWVTHLFTGYIDGRHITVTGVDTPAAQAAYAAWLPTPNPSPVAYATDEEKWAASYAEADPTHYGCAAPAGGWRSADGWEAVLDGYRTAHPGALVGWSSRLVGDDLTIALVATSADADLAAVRSDLQALLPDAACVVASTVTDSDLQRAIADPAFGPDPYVSYVNGLTPVDPYLALYKTVLTAGMARAIATYPTGLVRVTVWFNPLP